jgi:heterogeneous nuclear rnp K-like protein 2
MSATQDTLPPNGGDVLNSLDQLKLEDGEPRLGPDGEPAPRTDEEYAQAQLTLRAVVSSKEAGVIIGKGGQNVANLRDETGVKAGVSKVVQGVHDRVLTITGGCDAVSRAYSIVANSLLEGAPSVGMGGVVQNNGTHRKSASSLLDAITADLPPQPSSSSSPTTRWAPSSAVRA